MTGLTANRIVTMPNPSTCSLGQKFIVNWDGTNSLYFPFCEYGVDLWSLNKSGYIEMTITSLVDAVTSYQIEIFEQSLPSALGIPEGSLLSVVTGSWQSTNPLLPSAVGVPDGQLITADADTWVAAPSLLPAHGTAGNILESDGVSWISTPSLLPYPPGTSGNLLESNGSAWTSVASKLPAPSSAKNTMKSTGSAWISEAPNLVTVTTANPYTFTDSGPEAIQYETVGANITVRLPDGALMTRGRQFSVRWAAADGPYNISITNNSGSVTYATLDRPGIAYCTSVYLNNSADAWKIELVQLLLPTPSTSGNILTSDGNDWVSQAPKLPAPSTSGNVLRSTGAAWESAVVPVMPSAPAGNVIMASTGSSWAAETRDLSTVISTSTPAVFDNLSVNTFICKTIVEDILVQLPLPSTLTVGRVFTVTWDGTDDETGPYTINITTNFGSDVVSPVLVRQTVTCRCISISGDTVDNWAVEVTQSPGLPLPGANLNILESDGSIWESVAPKLPAHSTSGNLLESNGSAWLSVAPKLPAPSTYDNILKSDGIGNWISAPFLTSDLTEFDFKMYIQNSGSTIQYPANTTINGTYHCIPIYDSTLAETTQRVFCSFNLDLTATSGTTGSIMYYKLPFAPYPVTGTFGQNVMIIVNHPGGGGVQSTIYGNISFDYSTTRPCIKCDDYAAISANHFYSANFSYTATLDPWV